MRNELLFKCEWKKSLPQKGSDFPTPSWMTELRDRHTAAIAPFDGLPVLKPMDEISA